MSIQIVNGSRIYVRDVIEVAEEVAVVREDALLHEHEHEGGDLEQHDHEGGLNEEVENNDVSDSSDLGAGSDTGLWGS